MWAFHCLDVWLPLEIHTWITPLLHPGLYSHVTSSERRRHPLKTPFHLCSTAHLCCSVRDGQNWANSPSLLCTFQLPRLLDAGQNIWPHRAHSASMSPLWEASLMLSTSAPLLLLIKELVSILGYNLHWNLLEGILGMAAGTSRPQEIRDEQMTFLFFFFLFSFFLIGV